MRRPLVVGLTLVISVAVILGVRAWSRRAIPPLAAATVAPAEDEVKAGPAIPQDVAAIEKRRHEQLAWNRRTLQGAYDRVGKKDPRWDEAARRTLDLAARMFSLEVDPQVTPAELDQAARAAVEAGCDDPMIAYLYARASIRANHPGPEEALRRAKVAAQGLAASRYPALRRAVAMEIYGGMVLSREEADRKAAEGEYDAALALLEESVAIDERNEFWEASWLGTLKELTGGYRRLGVPAKAAYERVDAGLDRAGDGAKFLRLLYRGDFWLRHGWDARTEAFAPAVPAGGMETLEERLAIARQACEDAWKLRPGSGEVARLVLEIEKAVGHDRAAMELWFDRAIKADGDDRYACWSKLDWLDPKWHGSVDDMLAFGRACRDSKNSRTGITLLVADAHLRVACMPGADQIQYLKSPEVWADIRSVYEEYLKHHPVDDLARSKYATFCHLTAHYREAEVQYVALGDHLAQWSEFPYMPLGQLRQNRVRNARVVMGKEGRITFPGWHFVGGSNGEGEWFLNTPVGAPHREVPGILGAETSLVWACSADGITYGIRFQVLPPAVQDKGSAAILEAARGAVSKERGGPPRNVRDTLLAARPAQEYEIDTPGPRPVRARVKALVIGTWLYELSVATSQGDLDAASPREFFDSFAFRPVGEPFAGTNTP